MSISLYSFLSAIMWFNLFVVICALFRKRSIMIIKLGVPALLLVLFCTTIRLVFALEIPGFTKIIESTVILPSIHRILGTTIIQVDNIKISLFATLLAASSMVTIYKLVKLKISYDLFKNAYSYLHNYDTSQEALIIDGILSSNNKQVDYKIIKSPHIQSPMITGIFKPAIYLPMTEFSDQHLRYILLHELTHYLNRDMLFKLLIEIICAVLWWNPLVYLLRKDLSDILELKCDYSIVKKLSDKEKHEYIESLLAACEAKVESEKQLSFAFIGDGDAVAIRQRFDVLISFDRNNIRYRISLILIVFVLVSIFACSFAFIIQPGFDAPYELNESLGQPVYAEYDNNGGIVIYFDDSFCIVVDTQTYANEFNDVPIINKNK